ncbi:MAG: hypothetical protein GKR93_01425 [Gammaproteobacteria bacterium]|nr:hypothetical protein [Gammaproteobacteria bacterium]
MVKFKSRCEQGFSYAEVLVASALVAITLVPAMQALQPGIQASGIQQQLAEDRYQSYALMEQVLAEPFSALQSAAAAAGSETVSSSYSDSVTYSNGRVLNRLVFLSAYDADNSDADNDPFTGTESDLIWIKVEIEGSPHALESLSAL